MVPAALCLLCAVGRDAAGTVFRERQMKNNAQPHKKAELSALGSLNFTAPSRFTGTDNPRHLRTIQALMTRPITREHLDQIAGCSNGPELIAELRRRGLEVPCARTKKKDRDLFDCWPGVYHFTRQDRRRVLAWLTKRKA